MTFGGVEFGKECMSAQASQQAAGFLNSGVDFSGVCESRFESKGTQEFLKAIIREMPAAQRFVDEASDQPCRRTRGFGFRDDAPDTLRRVRFAVAEFVVGER